MFKSTLLISDEATGRSVVKVVNPLESVCIVPTTMLANEMTFSKELRGRTFTHVKINATLSREQYALLNRNLACVFHQASGG